MTTNFIEALAYLSQYLNKPKEEPLPKTPIQLRIETAVTNGRGIENIGLESFHSSSPYAEFIGAEGLRQTNEGLDAYLLFMNTQDRLQVNSEYICFTFGNSTKSDRIINWFIPSSDQIKETILLNQKVINEAYDTEGKRRGGREFLKEKRIEVMYEKFAKLLSPLIFTNLRYLQDKSNS